MPVGNYPADLSKTLHIFCQQNGLLRSIGDFGAQNRLYPCLEGQFIKRHGSVEPVGVGQGQCPVARDGGMLNQIFNSVCPTHYAGGNEWVVGEKGIIAVTI